MDSCVNNEKMGGWQRSAGPVVFRVYKIGGRRFRGRSERMKPEKFICSFQRFGGRSERMESEKFICSLRRLHRANKDLLI